MSTSLLEETGATIFFSIGTVSAVSGYVDVVAPDQQVYRVNGTISAGNLVVPRSSLVAVNEPGTCTLLPRVLDSEGTVYQLTPGSMEMRFIPTPGNLRYTSTTPLTASIYVAKRESEDSTVLRSDALAVHGLYTLSAVAGTVLSVAIPAWAHIIQIVSPSALVNWNINADPAVAGANALTAGGVAPANESTAIILYSGSETLRLSSTTASATLRLVFRGSAPV